MEKSLFEQMGGRYEMQSDYLIPCLTVPPEEEQPISIYGQQHLKYIQRTIQTAILYQSAHNLKTELLTLPR